jgi:hypothetical protein
MSEQIDLAAAARRHGLSDDAANVLFRALVAGGGRQAQFSHPELGGMGQWSGGMTQIGDMFNDALRAKVAGFCQEMAAAASARAGGAQGESSQWQRQGGSQPQGGDVAPLDNRERQWWPAHLGVPSSSGSQNAMRYACFPDKRRLAVERAGAVTIYDTGHHRLTGFSQQQSVGSDLSFSGQDGPVALDSLAVVDS